VAYLLLTGLPSYMIDALFNSADYQASRTMLDMTAMRHEAIASNLSNLETPNYKRIDVAANFESSLKQAIASNDTRQLETLRPILEIDKAANSTNRDGNSVVLEDELMAMNQNMLMHQLETQAISGDFMKLRLAITGRAG
jgi:flagellar basal-body rod protein FlgB